MLAFGLAYVDARVGSQFGADHGAARFHLTRITRPEELWTRHVLDRLSLLAEIQELQPGTVLDLGSGGGVPGIPLALMLPDLSFTLLESTARAVTRSQ